MYYNAAAKPRTPTTPPNPKARAAVCFGDPALEEDVEAALFAAVDPRLVAAVVVTAVVVAALPAEDVVEPAAEFRDETSDVSALSAELTPNPGLYVLKKACTFDGSWLYHAGVEPALNSLAKELTAAAFVS